MLTSPAERSGVWLCRSWSCQHRTSASRSSSAPRRRTCSPSRRARRHAAEQGRDRRCGRADLKSDDFYRPAHQTVFDAILDLYGRGEPADAVMVAGELTKRGRSTGSVARPTCTPWSRWCRPPRTPATTRGSCPSGRAASDGRRRHPDRADGVCGGPGEVDDLVDRAQAEVYSVTERRTSEDYQPLSALFDATIDEIEAIASHGEQTGRRADRVRGPGRVDQRAASRPADRHRRSAGDREVDDGAGRRAVGVASGTG